ncbi:uncharacterized protein LOC142324481 [Lycorma delicatula]|uniref:uncharacterized protein LOC142324481 n=1 Tax=Lycorma delicatula TaxID=130591 RepID=UPI003F51602C
MMACRFSLSIVLLLIQSWLISGHPTAPAKIKIEVPAPKVVTDVGATAKIPGAIVMQSSLPNYEQQLDTLQQLSQKPQEVFTDNRNNINKLLKQSSKLVFDPPMNLLDAYGVDSKPLSNLQQAIERTASNSIDNTAGLAFTASQLPFSMTRSFMKAVPLPLPFLSNQ